MLKSSQKFLLFSLVSFSTFTPAKADDELLKALAGIGVGALSYLGLKWMGQKWTESSDQNLLDTSERNMKLVQKYCSSSEYVYTDADYERVSLNILNTLMREIQQSQSLNGPEYISQNIGALHDQLLQAKQQLYAKIHEWQESSKYSHNVHRAHAILAAIDSRISEIQQLHTLFKDNCANFKLYLHTENLNQKYHYFTEKVDLSGCPTSYFLQLAAVHASKDTFSYIAYASILESDLRSLRSTMRLPGLTLSWRTYTKAYAVLASMDHVCKAIMSSPEYTQQKQDKLLYDLQKQQIEASQRAAKAAEAQAHAAQHQVYIARQQLNASREQAEATNRLARAKDRENYLLAELIKRLHERRQREGLEFFPQAIQALIDAINREIIRENNEQKIRRLFDELECALSREEMWFRL